MMYFEMDKYFAWLQNNTTLTRFSVRPRWIEITMPFLDRRGDHLQIYVLKENDNYLISDDGFILQDLKSSGYELNDFEMDEINIILKGLGISLKDEKLTTVAQLDNFPVKMNSMIQAMIVVGNLQ